MRLDAFWLVESLAVKGMNQDNKAKSSLLKENKNRNF